MSHRLNARPQRNIAVAALSAFLLFASVGSAFAQPYGRHSGGYHPAVREAIRDGSLNKKEVAAMKQRQQRIQEYKQKAMRDGRLSPKERQQIRFMERENMQITRRSAHDND
jgi:hypothetical protein